MNTPKKFCCAMIFGFVVLAAFAVKAEVVNFTLENVVLDDNTQMTGTFSWTYEAGDFENGTGQFIFLEIPHTSHNHEDLDATIDVTQSIEITLPNSRHDDGVDITLVLVEPLTPTTSSLIDLNVSQYEIGGNGFHDGFFISGRIAPERSFVPASSFNMFRGLLIGGTLQSTQESDDDYMKFNPGFTLNTEEAPVWVEFQSNVGTDFGNFDLVVESNAGTPGLTYTAEMWNYDMDSYDVVGSSDESFNSDTAETYPIIPSSHINAPAISNAELVGVKHL